MTSSKSTHRTKTCVLHVHQTKNSTATMFELEACLEEAIGLAEAIDLDIIHTQIIQLSKLSPATLIGQGNVTQLSDLIKEKDIELVIFDGALSPGQQRNLEKIWNCKVIDRTSLILEIFADRARTAEGRLQVELAMLTYQRTRLIRTWTHLERQRGGFGFTGGPGETQLEMDRRMIDDRIVRLKEQLEKTRRTRGLHRSARQDVPFPLVALVGYTNAGKSTLFNRLTQANVLAKSMLFATLDPTMRQLKLPSGRTAILSDTVGFISSLPTHLVAAFRATLEEVCSADLILHVRDAAHPNTDRQALEVEKVLTELGLEEKMRDGSVIDIYNKIDLLQQEGVNTFFLPSTEDNNSQQVALSAQTGEGIHSLCEIIDQQLNRHNINVTLDISSTAGDALAWLYRQGVIVNRTDEDGAIHLTLKIHPQDLEKFNKRFMPDQE